MNALTAANDAVTGSAPMAALLTRIEAKSLVLRIMGGNAVCQGLAVSARGRDMTPAEDALWTHAETDAADARKALVALVADRLGVDAATLTAVLA